MCTLAYLEYYIYHSAGGHNTTIKYSNRMVHVLCKLLPGMDLSNPKCFPVWYLYDLYLLLQPS